MRFKGRTSLRVIDRPKARRSCLGFPRGRANETDVNIVFLHQNMPGQFRHLIGRLVAEGHHRIVCVGRRTDFAPPGVGRVTYTLPDSGLTGPNLFLAPMDQAVRHGLQAARACEALSRNGFAPDLIVAHPGWGESLYVKEVFPRAPLLQYCEYFYAAHGADVNFDPMDQQSLEENCVTLTRNAPLLMALAAADWGISPTHWQKARHPRAFHDRISVLFDGIDTSLACPDRAASYALPDGTTIRARDEVVTYVARSLEPWRGFPSFVRALPAILAARPAARVAIAGADTVSYGKPPPDGLSWRESLLRDIPLDPARVHFLGVIPREDYIRLLQVSAVHVYLTVPFVLSWSMLEAMAAGCLVAGSDTPPVREVLVDGQNGVLVDFFSPAAIAARVVDVLAHPARYQAMRAAARWTALSRYSLERCLPPQVRLLETLARGELPALA